MSEIIKGPKQGQGYGDWSKISSSEYSVRAKKGILRQDPPDTYKVPNPKRSTRETKGPGL